MLNRELRGAHTATRIPQSKFNPSPIGNRQFEMPGGESNSRPTPKPFGAALPAQMMDCEAGVFLAFQISFNPARLC